MQYWYELFLELFLYCLLQYGLLLYCLFRHELLQCGLFPTAMATLATYERRGVLPSQLSIY